MSRPVDLHAGGGVDIYSPPRLPHYNGLLSQDPATETERSTPAYPDPWSTFNTHVQHDAFSSSRSPVRPPLVHPNDARSGHSAAVPQQDEATAKSRDHTSSVNKTNPTGSTSHPHPPSPSRRLAKLPMISATNKDLATTPDKTIFCSQCNVKFTGVHRRGNLGRHVRQKHRSARSRPHKCTAGACSKTFARSDALLKHQRNKHPGLGRQPASMRKEQHEDVTRPHRDQSMYTSTHHTLKSRQVTPCDDIPTQCQLPAQNLHPVSAARAPDDWLSSASNHYYETMDLGIQSSSQNNTAGCNSYYLSGSHSVYDPTHRQPLSALLVPAEFSTRPSSQGINTRASQHHMSTHTGPSSIPDLGPLHPFPAPNPYYPLLFTPEATQGFSSHRALPDHSRLLEQRNEHDIAHMEDSCIDPALLTWPVYKELEIDAE